MRIPEIIALFLVGAIGIGLYNIALNYGELSVSSGMASFIVSQSPLLTAIFAILFLKEGFSILSVIGFLTGIIGVALITLGEVGALKWDTGIAYILLATLIASTYSILQKPFLKKCHAIEATSYVIWGGTLFLLIYFPKMLQDFSTARLSTTLTVVYLGVFPAAIGYIAWSYALAEVPASRIVSFLYFSPLVATALGWILLDEKPAAISLFGGLFILGGVWLVNHPRKVIRDDLRDARRQFFSCGYVQKFIGAMRIRFGSKNSSN